MIIKNKIFESPDCINVNGEIVYWKFGISFCYCDGKMIISSKSHSSMSLEYGCKDIKYPGRIFTKYRIITFWNYPDPDKLNEIIRDLEKLLDFDMSDFYVEVLLEDGKITDWHSNMRKYVTKFINISDYEKYWFGVQNESNDHIKFKKFNIFIYETFIKKHF